jgi:anti-anti-sigma factor
MRLETRFREGVAIVGVKGRITIEEGSSEVRHQIRKLVVQGHNRVLVNLDKVSYVDSTGIGALVASYTTTVNAGGYLQLLKANAKIQRLLDTTRLLSVLNVYQDEDSAVASFN